MKGIKTVYLKLTEKQHEELSKLKAKSGASSWETYILGLAGVKA